MNRLAPHNTAPRTDKVRHLLDYLDDANPDEANTLRAWLADPAWGDKTVADVVTREIAMPDLGWKIGQLAVRNYRDQMETAA